MNLKQLQAFLVVAQERQITAAAKRLYMAQPPLLYQMKQLEKELGVKLFTRSSYGIELTPAGRTFQTYAQQMVKLRQAAGEALDQEKAGRMGTIHLGLISSTGDLVPNQAMQQLTVDYPHISFAISEGNTMELVDQLNSGLLDLAVVRTPFNTRGLEERSLYQDEMVALGDHDRFRFPAKEMKIGDYVLIPSNSSHQFTFARIAGDYEYNPQNKEGLWHSRDIGIIVDYIPSSIFSKSVRYSLGAYRTIFKAKDEEEILTEINKYIARKDL